MVRRAVVEALVACLREDAARFVAHAEGALLAAVAASEPITDMRDDPVEREYRGAHVVENGDARIDQDLAGRGRDARVDRAASMPTQPSSVAVGLLLRHVIGTWGCTAASAETCEAVLRQVYHAETQIQQRRRGVGVSSG